MILARAIPSPNEQGRVLMGRGGRVTADLGRRLEKFGIYEVWVVSGIDCLEDFIDEEVAERQRELYWVVRRSFEAVKTKTATEKPLDVSKFDSAVAALWEAVSRSRHGSVFMEKLDSYDNYLVSHSTNVCHLAMLMGMKLERYLIEERSVKASRAKDVSELALGCVLHDVGKLKLPQSILDKPGSLTPEETEVIQKHPLLGYEMVKGRVPASAAQVVLNHHQRYDGAGYPARFDPKTEQYLPPLSAKQIPVFSRIATVCDVYDAATAARCYSGAKPSVQAIWEMREQFAGAFDPIVEAAFYDIVPAFPIGSQVKLSDGSEAVVIEFHPRHSFRPKVQRLKTPDGARVDRPDLDEINLAHCDDLTIVGTGGTDIRKYLPSQKSRQAVLV
jgi:HD-GYP domain-containing protein (c-di-GMP phosphodiesterase class II)